MVPELFIIQSLQEKEAKVLNEVAFEDVTILWNGKNYGLLEER